MSKAAVLAVKIVGDATGGVTALKQTSDLAGGLMGKLKGFGVGGLALGGIAAGAGLAGKALYDVGATWDGVKDKIRVGTGASGEALKGMVDAAKNVASGIPAAISTIGPVVADVNTRMGLTGDTLTTVSKQYLEAGRMLGTTVDINKTSAAFGAFGIKGDAVVGAMDNLFRVSQATGVGMNDLATTVSKAGPAMTQLGFSFTDTAALAGTLDKAGIDSTATMAAMQKGLVTLAKAGKDPKESFGLIVGEMKGFIDAGEDATALDIASKVFGTRGATQFVAAVKSGTLSVDDLMGAAGTTSDTILGLGKETASAAEKWQILQNKALVALEPIGAAIFDGAGKALDWIIGLFENADLSGFDAGIKAVAAAFEGLGPLIAQAAELIQQLWPVVETTFAGIIAVIEPALATGQAIIQTVMAVIKGDWSAAWEGIQGIVSGVVNTIKNIIDGLSKTIQSIIKAIGLDKHFAGVLNAGRRVIEGGVRGIVDFFSRLPSRVLSALSSLGSRISGAFNGAMATGRSVIDAGLKGVVAFFTGLPGRVVAAVSGFGGMMGNVGRNVIEGLIGGIKGMAGRVVDSVRNVIDGAIGWAKDLLGIRSPSKVFQTIGTQTGQGLILGLLGQTRAVAKASSNMIEAAVPGSVPKIPVPALEYGPNNAAGGRRDPIQINFYGDVFDADSLVRRLRGAFNREARVRGVVDLAGTVFA